jgi:hypothetical protein
VLHYKAISHESYTKHGLSISTLLADEVHAWPTRELWELLVSSMGKRLSPLTIVTAGYGRGTLAWELYDYALKLERGDVEDETFLPVLYRAPHDCDWQDEAVWHAAASDQPDHRYALHGEADVGSSARTAASRSAASPRSRTNRRRRVRAAAACRG